MEFTARFQCKNCGETLGTTVKRNAVYHEEFHDCVGETFGYVGEIGEGTRGVVAPEVEIVIEEN
jgi:hypothetical protein